MRWRPILTAGGHLRPLRPCVNLLAVWHPIYGLGLEALGELLATHGVPIQGLGRGTWRRIRSDFTKELGYNGRVAGGSTLVRGGNPQVTRHTSTGHPGQEEVGSVH